MSSQPQWKNAFPIRQSEEHDVSRRQFCKIACCSVVAVGAGLVLKDRLFALPPGTAAKRIAHVNEIAVGGYRLFRYPTEEHPAILVRLSEGEFVAYSQSCTHLMCPVHYEHEKRHFYCPCHEGFFSAEDGRVLAGPPPKALPRYPVEIRGEEVWVVPG